MARTVTFAPGLPAPYQREQVVSELALNAVREPKPTFPEWARSDELALRALIAGGSLTDEAPKVATELLRGDEVTLERVSLALTRGPVAIAATPEQAARIIERHRKDAFPPQ